MKVGIDLKAQGMDPIELEFENSFPTLQLEVPKL